MNVWKCENESVKVSVWKCEGWLFRTNRLEADWVYKEEVFLLDSDQYLKDRKDKKIKTVSRQTWFTKKRWSISQQRQLDDKNPTNQVTHSICRLKLMYMRGYLQRRRLKATEAEGEPFTSWSLHTSHPGFLKHYRNITH